MVTAYVMVKAHTGEADRLKEEIEAVEGVKAAHIVAGDVDFIAKVEVNTPADVKDIVAANVQRLDGVEDTRTYVAMD